MMARPDLIPAAKDPVMLGMSMVFVFRGLDFGTLRVDDMSVQSSIFFFRAVRFEAFFLPFTACPVFP